MPSNAMKASQFIAHLQAEIETHGDLDMVFAAGMPIAIDGRNINVTVDMLGQRFPAPVIAIGQHRDERGRVTNMPGFAYEVTADSGEWTYDRNAAPEGVTVAVWKRRGGQDRGYRSGAQWFVYEGDETKRPVEIIPAGILGWKL